MGCSWVRMVDYWLLLASSSFIFHCLRRGQKAFIWWQVHLPQSSHILTITYVNEVILIWSEDGLQSLSQNLRQGALNQFNTLQHRLVLIIIIHIIIIISLIQSSFLCSLSLPPLSLSFHLLLHLCFFLCWLLFHLLNLFCLFWCFCFLLHFLFLCFGLWLCFLCFSYLDGFGFLFFNWLLSFGFFLFFLFFFCYFLLFFFQFFLFFLFFSLFDFFLNFLSCPPFFLLFQFPLISLHFLLVLSFGLSDGLQIFNSIFFHDFGFFFFQVLLESFDPIVIGLGPHVLSLFVEFFVFVGPLSFLLDFLPVRLAKGSPLCGNHFVDLFLLKILMFLAKLSKSLFIEANIGTLGFFCFGESSILILKFCSFFHSDFINFLVEFFFLGCEIAPFFGYFFVKGLHVEVAIRFFFTTPFEVESHIGVHGLGRRWYAKDAQGFLKIFFVLLIAIFFAVAAHFVNFDKSEFQNQIKSRLSNHKSASISMDKHPIIIDKSHQHEHHIIKLLFIIVFHKIVYTRFSWMSPPSFTLPLSRSSSTTSSVDGRTRLLCSDRSLCLQNDGSSPPNSAFRKFSKFKFFSILISSLIFLLVNFPYSNLFSWITRTSGNLKKSTVLPQVDVFLHLEQQQSSIVLSACQNLSMSQDTVLPLLMLMGRPQILSKVTDFLAHFLHLTVERIWDWKKSQMMESSLLRQQLDHSSLQIKIMLRFLKLIFLMDLLLIPGIWVWQ